MALLVVAWWLDHRRMGLAHEATLDLLSDIRASYLRASDSANVARQVLADSQLSLADVKRERAYLIQAALRRVESRASVKRTSFDERSF